MLGTRGFWNSEFIVNQHVLDPRPDSETLIEVVLRRLPDKEFNYRILDLGTGSGCLVLSLLQEFPNADGVGVDISTCALDVARQNATILGLQDRCKFKTGNWLDGLQGQYHIIISNPPYIESDMIKTLQAEVRDFEPHSALDGGEDGFECYDAILEDITRFMTTGALLAFEVGAGQANAVQDRMRHAGCHKIEISSDLAGVARVVSGFRKN